MRPPASRLSRRASILALTATVVAGLGLPGIARAAVLPYQDPSLPVATRVDDLLAPDDASTRRSAR